MKKKILHTILLYCLPVFGLAQDPHFSQFFLSPLTLNPALTGSFDGKVRVAGNYRNQWPSISNAYTTSTISIDGNIFQQNIPENNRLGFGILLLNDQNGDGILKSNYFSSSIAYTKSLDPNGFHLLTAGFQAAYGNKVFDVFKAKFEDQLIGQGFINVTSELLNNKTINISYLDISTGFMYTGSSSYKNRYYVGASIYHLNAAKQSLKNAQYILPIRYTIHSGGYWMLNEITTFHTSALFQWQGGKQSELMIGGAFSYLQGDEDENTEFHVGVWLRNKDALIPYAGLDWKYYKLGVSYDVTISSLRSSATLQGGMEVSLLYIFNEKQYKRPQIKCPIY